MQKNFTVAYVLNIYPKLSETFIEREISELRKYLELKIIALRNEGSISDQAFYLLNQNVILIVFKFCLFVLLNPLKFFHIFFIILGQYKKHALRALLKQILFLILAPSLISKIKKLQISHIHSHFGNATTLALFCKILNPKLIFSFTAHASADIYVLPELLELKCENADLIITNSEYNFHYLNSLCDYKIEEKIRVVRNSIKMITMESQSAEDYLNILSVGRLIKCKGFQSLIRIAEILRKRNLLFKLKIIGGGEERSNIEDSIKKLKLNEFVELMDEMSNDLIMHEIGKCDIFVLASEISENGYRDGMPTVLIEAMSLGKPVISTYISGISELIDDGVNGLLVPERNLEKFADAVMKLSEDRRLRTEMGKNARINIEKNYNIEKNIKHLANCFKDISEK